MATTTTLQTSERFLGVLRPGESHYQKIFQAYPTAFAMAKKVEGWMEEGKDGELVYSTPAGDHTLHYSHEKDSLTVVDPSGTRLPTRYYRMTTLQPPLVKWRDSAFSLVPLALVKEALQESSLRDGHLGPLFQTLFTGCVQSESLSWAAFKEAKELDSLKEDDSLCLAFHGTKPGAAFSIFKDGFDMSKCGTNGSRFGRGLYMTADWLTAKNYGKDKAVVVTLFRCNKDSSIVSLVAFAGRMCGTKETVVVRNKTNAIPLGVILL